MSVGGMEIAAKTIMRRFMASLQGVYFLITGMWPLLHMDSFLAVTGPKTDVWLVQIVGALVCVPAVLLLRAARSIESTDRITVTIACAFSAVLLSADLAFVARGDIAPIYLADAALEALFLLGWASCEVLPLERSQLGAVG
jgi:hypothetical protein